MSVSTSISETKLLKKPNIKIDVYRVEPNVWVDLGFSKYHYLTSDLNKSAKCFLFSIDGLPCGFVALLNTPRKGLPNGFAISRIVILPDFQGLGLSTTILNFIGGIVRNYKEDAHLYIKTVHELMGSYFERSDKWRATAHNGKERSEKESRYEMEHGHKYKSRLGRKSFCYEYVGDKIRGYEELMLPIGELRKKRGSNN